MENYPLLFNHFVNIENLQNTRKRIPTCPLTKSIHHNQLLFPEYYFFHEAWYQEVIKCVSINVQFNHSSLIIIKLYCNLIHDFYVH